MKDLEKEAVEIWNMVTNACIDSMNGDASTKQTQAVGEELRKRLVAICKDERLN